MLDEHVERAVRQACEEAGQCTILANEILAWLEAVRVGNESLDDDDSVGRRLELLYDSVNVDEAAEE